jgi:hypothetical protein
MVELGQLALDLIINLLAGVILEGANYMALPFFERRRIERRIEDAIAEVVEPLLPFLAQERIPEDKQRRLIQTCVDELRPLTKNPERLFQGSLDGQKIFEEMYASRDLPQVVIEDDLKDIYTLLCPRIATLLCKIPAAVKDWENEAWSENYRRLDEITTQLRKLFSTVDALATSPSRQADEMLSIVRRSLAQKVRLELDLTGLRADRPLAGKFDDYFVHPEIKEITKDEKKQPQVVGTPDDSFTQFTHRYRQAIVVGPAGAGKSTWTKWLQRETLTPRWTGISVRVELRRFSSEPLLSLHDLIRETAGRHLAEDLTAERISHWLNAKQVIFVLDGFDEIRPGERDNVYDWIVELRSAARGCPFVLTSRPLTTDHLDRLNAGWQRWTIEPFDKSRIVDYIQRWYAHTPLLLDGARAIDAEKLATSWRGDPTIKPLTGNPLLLSTLLMVHHLDGSLPSGRSQLYRRYVEGMLGLWDDRRRVSATSVQLTLEQKRQITRGFALKLFFEEQDQLDESATLEWLQEFLQRMNISIPAPEILDMLRERSGLIVGPGIYSFAHKSIAEYLVAEAVLQGDQRDASGTRIDRFCLFEHRDDDTWNTVTFLWAGLAPVADVEAFIEECIEAKNWALAYGILYDQYERIPIDIRRRLFLQLTASEQLPEIWETAMWIVSQPGTVPRVSLPIPIFFHLRGLVPHLVFFEVVDKAAMDGTIPWSDQTNAKGEWKDLLWMSFAKQPNNIDVWKACLASPYPSSASPIEWLYWVAEFAFYRAMTQETVGMETVLETYQEACPQARGLVPIALMSVGLQLVLREGPEPSQSTYENVTKLLEVLPDSDKGDVIPEWLLGTRKWVLGRGRSFQEPIGDLLAVFVDQMEELVKQGHIERNVTYERAIQFVRELQNRRDALDVST